MAEFGVRVLDHISPPNWTLEWSLPGWLGGALGLDASSVADLTLANVLGLAYIKLQDDLSDDEVGEDDRQAARCCRRCSTGNGCWFTPDSSRAVRHSGVISNGIWRSGYGRPGPAARSTPKPWAAWGEEDLLVLGHRGAPLKICAAGAVPVGATGRADPALESALDHLLIGAVLLDHALDWAGDLAADRHNAFVAYASVLAADGRASGGQPAGRCGGASWLARRDSPTSACCAASSQPRRR